MTRASKRDLAARLVWLLMDKCSFLNRGMASIPRGYGKRKWKETILYWQTHYWPCRGSKNNEQRSFRKEPSRIIAAGNAGLLGHDGDWVGSPAIRVGSINQIIGESDHPGMLKSLSQKRRHPDSCPFVRCRYLREPTIHSIHDTYGQPIYLGWFWVQIFILSSEYVLIFCLQKYGYQNNTECNFQAFITLQDKA